MVYTGAIRGHSRNVSYPLYKAMCKGHFLARLDDELGVLVHQLNERCRIDQCDVAGFKPNPFALFPDAEGRAYRSGGLGF
jgi:hypothetical protein